MTDKLTGKKETTFAGKTNHVLRIEDVKTSQDIIEIASNHLHLITSLQKKALINTEDHCASCSLPMNLVMRKNSLGQYGFLCKKCNAVSPLSKGTFFEKNRLSYEGVLLSLFSWACHVKPHSAASLYGISASKVVKQYQSFRKVCTMKLSKNPIRIGGIDNIIEVDDNLYAIPSKNLMQNDLREWIVGMYSHEDLTGVLIIIKNRNGETLFDSIKKHVVPGSTVWTNDIQGLEKLTFHGYPHATFQQSAGAHIQYLPQYWTSAKNYFRNNCRIKAHQITEDYLNEFMWMAKYGPSHLEAYRNMLKHISECYPINVQKSKTDSQ